MKDGRKELVRAIADRKAVLIVGAGVSRGASGRPEALWVELIRHGIAHCENVVRRLRDGWADWCREGIEQSDPDQMVAIAEMVSRKLGAPDDVRFRNWLEATVGSFEIEDARVLEAIGDLALPTATTNYDDLLARAMHQPPVTWRQPDRVLAALNGHEPGVVHLHGLWREPDSVVLGIRSYDQVLNHEAAQALQRGLALFHSLVFIGCGAGLADPNFGALRDWLRKTFAGQPQHHFRLCLEGELAELERTHAGDRILPFPYGADHKDLAPFLRSLKTDAEKPSKKKQGRPRGEEDRAPPAAAPADGLQSRYLERLRSAHLFLPLAGFENRVRIPIRLDEVYVPLRAQLYQPATEHEYKEIGAQRELLRELGEERDVPFDEALALAGGLGLRGAVVLGDPGSGKTTLLRHFISAMTDPDAGPGALGLPADTIPVFVELRRLGRPTAGLRSALTEAVSKADISLADSEAPAFVDALLARDGLLVLIDGLDEVADPAERTAVSRWLEEAIDALPRSRFVITSRYAGYKGDSRLSGKFLELRVWDLSPEEAERFIGKWYGAVESQAELGRDPEVAAQVAAVAATDLLDRVFTEDARTKSLRDLATNPLLLQILCLVHRDRKHLPERRVELYRQCTQVLLEVWRRFKKMPVDLTAERALKLLQPLAHWLHREELREAPAAQLLPQLAGPLKLLGHSPETGEEVLAAIRDQSGLVVSLGQGQYGFLHQSFQEYLCARHLQDQALRRPELLSRLAGHFGDDWWREVILLTVGLSNPSLFEPLVAEITRQGGLARDVRLADDLLRDAAEPTPAPLIQVLAEGLAEPDYRYHALRLLRELPAWEEVELPDGASPRRLLQSLARQDPSAQVRGMAGEVLGLEEAGPARLAGVGSVEPDPGTEWIHEPSGVVLVYVPGGDYPQGAEDITDDVKPVHTVKLSPFWIGKYPVTNAEYARFLDAKPDQQQPAYWDDKRWNAPQQPVVGVSWDEAKAFCAWASLALPSEAQWEAAARGKDGWAYPWGNDEPTPERANFGGREGGTTPVGSYPRGAGPFGSLDLAGNVWEWCEDVWNDKAYRKRSSGTIDPVFTEGEAAVRVVRGGAWNDTGRDLRAAYRVRWLSTFRYRFRGFRCVCRAGLEP